MIKKLAVTLLFFSVATASALTACECKNNTSTITTEATINQEIAPDTAKIRFFVENSGINLKDLKDKNDKIVNDAIVAIKTKLNINESIKTIAFSVSNVYSYKNKVRIFDKYQVRNGFEVKLKDLDKVSTIINLAMEKGVKNVGNVNFIVEDTESICNNMMAEAVKIGKTRIEILAKAAGSILDKPSSINPYCSLSPSHVQPRMNKLMTSFDSAGTSEAVQMDTIEPGTINARASVNMVYYLK